MTDGWDESAGAWIADMAGDQGDWGRRHVLDAPMLARVQAAAFSSSAPSAGAWSRHGPGPASRCSSRAWRSWCWRATACCFWSRGN